MENCYIVTGIKTEMVTMKMLHEEYEEEDELMARDYSARECNIS